MKLCTLQSFHSSSLQPFNPSTLQAFNPSTLQFFNPSTLEPFNPSTLLSFHSSSFKPSTLQHFNFSTRQPFNPSTLPPFNPSIRQAFNPSILQPFHLSPVVDKSLASQEIFSQRFVRKPPHLLASNYEPGPVGPHGAALRAGSALRADRAGPSGRGMLATQHCWQKTRRYRARIQSRNEFWI